MKRLLATLCLVLAAAVPAAQAAEARPVVLASLAPVHALAQELLEGTNVELRLLPASPRSMQSHQALFVRQAERYAADFRDADALIWMGSVWSGDPLYTSVREVNIRAVPIDAARPWSHERDGVALAVSPVNGEPLLPVWLSLGNVIRMIDIIGSDLQALYPDEAVRIRENQVRSRQTWSTLKTETELALLELDDPQLFALADEFAYLARDLGLFVAGYFVKQDLDWTPEDLATLTRRLQDGGVRVVVHKWEPEESIRQAVEAAGARLVVLDTLETSTAFRDDFRANLERLQEAFTGL